MLFSVHPFLIDGDRDVTYKPIRPTESPLPAAAKPIAFRPFALRRAHLRVLVAAMDAVQDYLTDPHVLEAAERFYDRSFANADALSRHLSAHDGHSQFYPWLLWDAEQPRGRLGRRLLEPTATGAEREIVQALLRNRADVYQVAECTEEAATLERVADGRLLRIDEPVLGTVSAPGELLIARILDLGDHHLLDAVHACLPPQGRRGLVRAARRSRRCRAEEQLPLLLAAAGRAMRRLQRAQPSLNAPDGGPVTQTTLVFEMRDPAAISARFHSAVASGLLRDQGSRWLVINSRSDLTGVTLRLSGRRLHATTSCSERADRLRQRLQAWLPELRYIAAVHRDLDALLMAEHWRDEEMVELRRLGEQWLEEYLTAFKDRPQRTLGGRTPREAVRTVRGRDKVHALLRSVQRFSDAVGTDCSPMVDMIWDELSQHRR